jgi:hypothetical protein
MIRQIYTVRGFVASRGTVGQGRPDSCRSVTGSTALCRERRATDFGMIVVADVRIRSR